MVQAMLVPKRVEAGHEQQHEREEHHGADDVHDIHHVAEANADAVNAA